MSHYHKAQFVPKIFSIFSWGYRLADFRADLFAGLTVAVVALPLSMALGIASGASPEKGLITAVIAGFLISLLGGSRIQVGGPTGAFVVIVFKIITQFGYDGLILATLMAGVILVIAGYARLGQLIKFIPYPVVTGFTTGIAIIIASTQVKEFFGLRVGAISSEFIPQWKAYFASFSTVNLAALSVGLATLTAILLLRKFAPRIPSYLIALVGVSLIVKLFHIPVETIGTRFPGITSGLSIPAFPAWSIDRLLLLIPSAFTIAFLAGIEALLSAMVADGMTGFRHRSNQELIGQGFANIGSALFGGLPATGAIARTATNIAAGGRTPVSGICHALFIMLFMFFGMDLMQYVPMAVLAAILFLVAWGMSEVHHFVHIFKLSSMDRYILILTCFLTVFIDLTVAIGVGVTLASLLFMARMSKAVEISNGPKEFERMNKEQDQLLNLSPNVEVFWIEGPIFFGIAQKLLDTIKHLKKTPKVLVIRMRLVPYIDATGASALGKLVQHCQSNNTIVIFSSMQKQPTEILSKFQKGKRGVQMEFTSTYEDALHRAKKIVGETTLNPSDTPVKLSC